VNLCPLDVPFCTLRTPALMSYKVRLLTWSLKLLRSMLDAGLFTREKERSNWGIERVLFWLKRRYYF
jgi:hypothetical protein